MQPPLAHSPIPHFIGLLSSPTHQELITQMVKSPSAKDQVEEIWKPKDMDVR